MLTQKVMFFCIDYVSKLEQDQTIWTNFSHLLNKALEKKISSYLAKVQLRSSQGKYFC